MAHLLFKDVNKVYPNGYHAVHDFNMEVNDGEFICLVGDSGCGKSTTLRMIAGLEDITSGEFYIDGKLANQMTSRERGIAMVFQSYALYPHLTVYENLAFGLTLEGIDADIIEEKVQATAKILGLTEYLERFPRNLSGGQCQRVAVGRALIRKVNIFLMDEPLSNLDAKQRVTMRSEIKQIHRSVGATTIYVTHDQTEAMTMSDRIVVMKAGGYVQQIGTPYELYFNPANLFVAGFIGTPQMNFFPATLTQENGKTYVEFVNNKILLPKTVQARIRNIEEYANTGKPITLGVRPEDIHEEESFIAASPDTVIKAFVEVVEKLGAETLIYCKLDFKEGEEVSTVIGDSSNMIAKIDSRSVISRGEITELAIDARHIHIFDGATEMSLLARDEGYEVTPENETSSAFVPLTPQEMQAIIEKNRVVTKEEKAAMRREARAAARKEKAEAKAAAAAQQEAQEEKAEEPKDEENK